MSGRYSIAQMTGGFWELQHVQEMTMPLNQETQRIKENLMALLAEISAQSSYKRHMDGTIGNLYAQELKARTVLFKEAGNLVDGISAKGPAAEFKQLVEQAFEEKTAANDWGWGSNWPDHVQVSVRREVDDAVTGFFRSHAQ